MSSSGPISKVLYPFTVKTLQAINIFELNFFQILTVSNSPRENSGPCRHGSFGLGAFVCSIMSGAQLEKEYVTSVHQFKIWTSLNTKSVLVVD